MNKRIFEQDGVQPHQGHASGDTDVEKAASQLVSDVKYKVNKELDKSTSLSPAEVAKRYQQRLAASPAPPAVKAIAKKKLTPDAPSGSVSEEVKDSDVKWVVVTDKKTGNTYRRRAGQAKRAELRSNPNISRVEVTGYHPDEEDDKQGQKTARVKAGKGLDQDGDNDTDFADVMSARMQASGMSKSSANKKVSDKPYNKKGGDVKEGFSDWRSDLREIVDSEMVSSKKNDQIKEKNVNNKININPNIDLGEKINRMGGELLEMIEIDEEINFEGILDEICDAELMFLTNDIIEQAVEEFFLECIDEGYEIETVSDMLIESLDNSLEMIYEESDSYHDSASKLRRVNRTQKVKDTVKKVGKSLLHGVGYAARKVVDTAKKAGSEIKKGYEAAGSSDSDSSSGTRKPQSYRYAKKAEKKPGLSSRLGSALKSGLKKAVAGGARAVSRGARNVARSMSEENIQEVSPPGFEGTVKAMKKHKKDIDNPWALAWYMKKKGFKSHKTKTGKDLPEAMNQMAATQKQTQATQQDQKQQKLQQQQATSDKPTAQERKLANIQKQQLAAKLKQVQTGTPLGEARAEDKRGLTPTGEQRQRQKTGTVTSSGQVAHPATSYSGGQNPHLRGKGGGNKEQRRAASRRYVDQPGGVYAKPENEQGAGRYAAMQSKKRQKPDLGSRFD